MIIVITHASIFLKLEGSGFQGFKMWALGFTAYQDARGCRSEEHWLVGRIEDFGVPRIRKADRHANVVVVP